mgnify:FL=1
MINVSKNSNISVYSYRHYKVKYKNLSEIKSSQNFFYKPQIDMKKYMDVKSFTLWREEEKNNLKHPDGYNVKK